MDVQLIQKALDGSVSLDELSVPERLALAQVEVLRVDITPKYEAPLRFLLPPAIERMYRGRCD